MTASIHPVPDPQAEWLSHWYWLSALWLSRYKLDSQGKLGKAAWEEHENKTVDERMVDALKKRKLDPNSDSRPMQPEDFQRFDFIIAMNDENVQEVHKAAQYWKDEAKKPIPGNWKDKVSLQLQL